MSKYGNEYYMQVPRNVWDYELPDNSQRLYFWLNELEQRFCFGVASDKGVQNGSDDWFWHTTEQFMSELNWSKPTFLAARQELLEHDLIKCVRSNKSPSKDYTSEWERERHMLPYVTCWYHVNNHYEVQKERAKRESKG